jgi:hypothetical protein
MTKFQASALLIAASSLMSCKGAVDKISDAVTKDPQRSYCEALCDWASDCHEDNRDNADAAAIKAQCLTDTRASDPDCGVAEGEGLDAATSLAVTECVEVIDENAEAGECDAFTGSIDDIKIGVIPPECGTLGTDAQKTYDAAREATNENNDELCERFAHEFCTLTTECIIGDFAVPDTAIDTVGQPYDLCLTSLDAVVTKCKTDLQYDAEDDLTDVNTARQGARECLEGVETMTCDDAFGGNYPATCAAAFASADDMLGFAGSLASVACAFKDYSDGIANSGLCN